MKSRSRQMLFPYPATLAAFLLYNHPFVTFLSWGFSDFEEKLNEFIRGDILYEAIIKIMLANISKLWAMYKPSKEFQPIVFSAILTGYFFYKLEFGGENAAERRAEEKGRGEPDLSIIKTCNLQYEFLNCHPSCKRAELHHGKLIIL